MKKLIYIVRVINPNCNQPAQHTEVTVMQSTDYEDSFVIVGYERTNDEKPQVFAKEFFKEPSTDVFTHRLAIAGLSEISRLDKVDGNVKVFTTKAKF